MSETKNTQGVPLEKDRLDQAQAQTLEPKEVSSGQEAVAEDAVAASASADKPEKAVSRRALFGALVAGASAVAAKSAAAAAACECLPPPDCNAVCPDGGSPRGDGTQACDCIEVPKPRALSLVDGGDAINSWKWGGKELRLNHNSTDTWIPVISGDYVDYVLKSEIVSQGGGGKIGAATIWAVEHCGGNAKLKIRDCFNDKNSVGNWWEAKTHRSLGVARDEWGRVVDVFYGSYYNQCNCDCNCASNCCGDSEGV